MKSILPEWYSPDNETIRKILETGTIALDTNALLDLYRVGREQREEILSVLRDSRERLFVPYQVCFEFLRRRLGVVADNEAIYESIRDSVQVKTAQLEQIRDLAVRKRVEQLSQRAQKSFAAALDKLREEHTISLKEAREDDPVQQALDELLGPAQLGQEPPEEDLAERRAEADRRGDAKIPPGFADKGQKYDASGDYLIWAELLDHAEQSGRPLLFVTNDEGKGDWYREVRGQTVGPCTELIVEMRGVTEQPYHQTNLSSFLFLAKKYLDAKVDDETITTVKNIPHTKTPSAQDNLVRAEAMASLMAAQDQNRNLGVGLSGDKYPGVNLVGLLGENYFAKHGIENPLTSIGASMAASHPGFSILPPGTPSALEAILGTQEVQRPFIDSLLRSAFQAGPYGTPTPEKSDPEKATPDANKALPMKEPAKKAPVKKIPARKAPAAEKATARKKARRAK